MKIVLIPDKFKGSLDAASVAAAMEEGIRMHYPDAECRTFAASDGGDGFLEAVAAFRTLVPVETVVADPLGRPIQARYLWDPEKQEAYIEMAQASGLVLLQASERDPLKTHTLGTGQLLLAALEKGAKKIYIGLGGSATSDGGMGLAIALGFRFLDEKGKTLKPSGASLERMDRILVPENGGPLGATELIAVNDVANPLFGTDGAAYVYAPQKGADPDAVQVLDRGLRNLSEVVDRDLHIEASSLPGAGAAGGASYGLHVFGGARFISGSQYILWQSGATDFLEKEPVDYLLTGEGRLDAQSLQGKWIQGVLGLARQHTVPVVAVCGKSDLSKEDKEAVGPFTVLETADPKRPLDWNMKHAYTQVKDTVADFFGTIKSG